MTPAPAPDLLVIGGYRYHPGTPAPVPGGLAVTDGQISALAADTDLRALRGPRTEVLDLDGGLVLPGFQDAHAHPAQGGVQRGRCDLTGDKHPAGYAATVRRYAAALPHPAWVLGGGWSMDAFPGGLPTAVELDVLTGGRPAYLPNRDHHTAWVNTAALRHARITDETSDPVDGRIERDAGGHPTGALHEGAMDLVAALLPPTSAAELRSGVLTGQHHLHSLGITAWQDALIGASSLMPDFYDAYRSLDQDRLLTARVVGSLWWDRFLGLDQLDFLCDRRSAAAGHRFRAGTVKIMLDGVCETGTASMLADYLDPSGSPTGNTGLRFVATDALPAIAIALDAAGFQIHLHALGDRAVRDALDALHAARVANGPSDRRHHIAHLQVVHPDDVPRFGALEVTANCQALWACAEPVMTELTLPVLGEPRGSWQYPFASIAATGGRLALGSDWPVSSPAPLAIVQTAVTRTVPGDPDSRPFLPGERLGLAAALTAATAGGAYVNHLDDLTGRLAVGYAADLAVLDRDPFLVPVREIDHTRVLAAFVDGVCVHRADSLRAD